RAQTRGGAAGGWALFRVPPRAAPGRATPLSVSREALPSLDEDEFYFSDLLDLAVVTDTGDPVGRVCAVENFGATDIVEIEKPDGKKFMVPLTRQAVPGWDERTLTIAEGFWDR
ncbi:MAG: PRC-barrel domain-containing protein, partial [Pseudomonadota bacterium]|nr:PRC-barrel domain-containing protein [Pseudomonadota bacterium]